METVQRPGRAGAQKIGASPGAANTEPAQEGNVHPVAWFFGLASGVSGLLLAAAGFLGEDVTPEAMGMIMGALSYALGTRRLGAATLLVSTVLLIVVLAVGNGDLPGIVAGW